MRRHLRVSAVDGRLVEASLGDARSQIVGNELRRDAAEERERPYVRVDPIDQALRERSFRIGVAGSAENRDEQLTDAHFACRPVRYLQCCAGVVHEHPFASDMRLPHGWRQPRLKGAVKFAEPAVAITVGVGAAMLFPQQLKRHARPAQLTMDCRPVGLRAPIMGGDLRRRIEQPLQRLIAEILGQRPAQAGTSRPPNAVARRRLPDRQARCDLAFRHAAGTKPQHIAYLAHG